MTIEEYEMIEDIVYDDINEGNVEDLIKLRNFLNMQIDLLDNTKKNQDNEEKYFDILDLKIAKFLNMKAHSDSIFEKNQLLLVLSDIKNISASYLLVADTLGLGKNTLLNYKQIGEYTINRYETFLNSYGYSLNHPLSLERQEEFINYKKLKGYKK